MLQIRFLGQFDVRADGKRLLISTRAAQLLLGFLVLSAGTSHRREKIAGLLWPDVTDENARRSLRQELWRLRKVLNSQTTVEASSQTSEYLVAEEFNISFNAASSYWFDVAQLEQPVSGDEVLNDLTRQLALYKGELLPGFYDDWVQLERERVEQVFERKMQQLVEHLVRQERWTAALEWGERWIAQGHTPEPAYRALMLSHAVLGNPSQVTVNYERCVHALQNELGVEPSEETRVLYEHLLKGAQLHLAPVQPSATVTFLFIDIEGSTRLLDRLREQYAQVLHEHHEIMRAAVQKWNGREMDTQGDAFFVTFARARDAVACAVEAQRALNAHAWPGGEPVRVRMGLHTGEPLVATTGYIGMDVHRAARIGDAGHGGQVLLSQTTRDLVAQELPEGTALRALGEHRLKDLKFPTEIYQLVMDGLPVEFPPLRTTSAANEPPAPGVPPFKGLEFFDEGDARLFFGREELTAKLVNALRVNRFLAVVVGASGSGKSSVVRAGLIPALRQPLPAMASDTWQIYVMTPTAHPLEALAVTLTRGLQSVTTTASLMDDLVQDARSLQLFLRRTMDAERRANKDNPISPSGLERSLLVVDQFEELFTLCHDEFEREQFIDNLLDAIHVAARDGASRSELLTLVLTIRADFYAFLAQYPELRDSVAAHQEYIGAMNVEELRRAIEEPARQGGWEFEPGLVDLILRDAGDEPGALPLLSHALLETWKRRAGYRMTLKGYADAGGVRGAIAQTAESVYEALPPGEQQIARNIFLRLTELGEETEDTRRRATFAELLAQSEQVAETRSVLNTLANARLVTLGQESVEVAHEALIREWSRLRAWLNEDREGLRLHRSLTEAAHEWEFLERDAGALYRGARLAQAREWASTNTDRLNESERMFLEASEEQAKRETREREDRQERELLAAQRLADTERQRAEESNRAAQQLRQRAVLLAGALLLALILAASALFFGDRANQNARAAAQNALTADKARAEAEIQQRVADSRALAAGALNNLSIDPQRSILLALEAARVTAPERTVLPEAQDALHRAIIASHVEAVLSIDPTPTAGGPVSVYQMHHAAYSPDGSRIATRSLGAFRIWDAASRKELLNLPVSADFGAIGLAYNRDGSQIATIDHDAKSGTDTVVKVFDANSGTLLRQVALAQNWLDVVGVGFSPDLSRVILMLFGEKPASMWDTTSGESLPPLPIAAGDDLFPDVSFSSDGGRIAFATANTAARIFDSSTGAEALTLCCHADTVRRIVFSPDGRRVATAGWDSKIKIWDAVDGKELATLAGHSNVVTDLAWSPDGKRLASVSWDRKAIVWNIEIGKQIYELPGHTDFVQDVDFSPDGARLVTASLDGTALIWDVGPSRELAAMDGPPKMYGVGFNSKRTHFYSTQSQGLSSANQSHGVLKMWDTQTLQTTRTFADFGLERGMTISPDEKWGGFVAADQTIRILDLETGKEIHTLSAGVADIYVWSPKFSPDSKRVAVPQNTDAMQLVLWNVGTGERIATFPVGEFNSNFLNIVAWTPDAARLVTGKSDGVTQVWDATTGALLFDLPGHKNYINAIVYSADGTRLATTSRDGMAIVYEASTGRELYRLVGHASEVSTLDFSPDGKFIVTASSDGTAKVWDASAGKELVSLYHSPDAVSGVMFTADSKHIITTSEDGALRMYTLDAPELVELARSRLIRTWRQDECFKFLHLQECPP